MHYRLCSQRANQFLTRFCTIGGCQAAAYARPLQAAAKRARSIHKPSSRRTNPSRTRAIDTTGSCMPELCRKVCRKVFCVALLFIKVANSCNCIWKVACLRNECGTARLIERRCDECLRQLLHDRISLRTAHVLQVLKEISNICLHLGKCLKTVGHLLRLQLF